MIDEERRHYSLDFFTGPLPLLLQLVQKQEIEIVEIALKILTEQYANGEEDIEEGAEFISIVSTMLLLKSRALLPNQEDDLEIPLQEEETSPLSLLPHLIEYCRFKEIAKELHEKEERQSAFYIRGCNFLQEAHKKPLGIEHISLGELGSLFKEILRKSAKRIGVIHEEEWRVSDRLCLLRSQFAELQRVQFEQLFPVSNCREELIVVFLAVLELMKQGEIRIIREVETKTIWVEAVYG